MLHVWWSDICLTAACGTPKACAQQHCGPQLTRVIWHFCRTYEASGHDMHSLLFNFLDELLFVFSTELFVPAELRITKFDRSEWCIQASGCVQAILCCCLFVRLWSIS